MIDMTDATDSGENDAGVSFSKPNSQVRRRCSVNQE